MSYWPIVKPPLWLRPIMFFCKRFGVDVFFQHGQPGPIKWHLSFQKRRKDGLS